MLNIVKNILIFALTLLGITACVNTDISDMQNRHKVIEHRYDTYTVRQKDTLPTIANKFAIDQQVLANFNNISLKANLHVGQILKIPVPQTVINSEIPLLAKNSLLWPVKGKVVKVFSNNAQGNKGINIAGWLGQEIKASGDGKVVFKGKSLTGFGNMLIIKHSEDVVTVYTFIQNALVQEGQLVRAGDKIAYIGNNSSGDVLLHFEVRIKGVPHDPLVYLQKI